MSEIVELYKKIFNQTDFFDLGQESKDFSEKPSVAKFNEICVRHCDTYSVLNKMADLLILKITKMSSFELTESLKIIMITFERKRLDLNPFLPQFPSNSDQLLTAIVDCNSKRLIEMHQYIEFFDSVTKIL